MFQVIATLPFCLIGLSILAVVATITVRILWELLPTVAMVIAGAIMAAFASGEVYFPTRGQWENWLVLNVVFVLVLAVAYGLFKIFKPVRTPVRAASGRHRRADNREGL